MEDLGSIPVIHLHFPDRYAPPAFLLRPAPPQGSHFFCAPRPLSPRAPANPDSIPTHFKLPVKSCDPSCQCSISAIKLELESSGSLTPVTGFQVFNVPSHHSTRPARVYSFSGRPHSVTGHLSQAVPTQAGHRSVRAGIGTPGPRRSRPPPHLESYPPGINVYIHV
jgi:hypothetical protein